MLLVTFMSSSHARTMSRQEAVPAENVVFHVTVAPSSPADLCLLDAGFPHFCEIQPALPSLCDFVDGLYC